METHHEKFLREQLPHCWRRLADTSVEKFNSGSVGTSGTVTQIVRHNIVEDGGVFFGGLWKKSVLQQ